MNTTEPKFAILVDGDNAQPKTLKLILEEISAKYGKATIRRIYGDWTDPKMKSWKNMVNELSFDPKQKFTYTSGKNSTDGALIIDAMDILHSKSVDGFCIVSSDSDFTGLAKRIREEGVVVIGMGKKTTPQAFVQSCEVFTFVENLSLPAAKEDEVEAKEQHLPSVEDKIADPIKPKTAKATKSDKGSQSANSVGQKKNTSRSVVPADVIELVTKAFNSIVDETENVHIAEFGSAIKRLDPSFDVRTYGVNSFLKFLKLVGIFEIQDNEVGKHNHPMIKRKKGC
ncbi:MAG: NYN domain-containing protein [Odoribacter sp.]